MNCRSQGGRFNASPHCYVSLLEQVWWRLPAQSIQWHIRGSWVLIPTPLPGLVAYFWLPQLRNWIDGSNFALPTQRIRNGAKPSTLSRFPQVPVFHNLDRSFIFNKEYLVINDLKGRKVRAVRHPGRDSEKCWQTSAESSFPNLCELLNKALCSYRLHRLKPHHFVQKQRRSLALLVTFMIVFSCLESSGMLTRTSQNVKAVFSPSALRSWCSPLGKSRRARRS